MDNYALDNFIGNIKKNEKPLKGLGIRPVHWGRFKAVKNKKAGEMNLADMVGLYEWSKGVLRNSAHQFDFILQYHPESPKYWLRNIEREKDDDGNYQVALDLEGFIENSENKKKYNKLGGGFYIPDNYKLAKIVLKEFNKEYKKRHKLADVSYREIAVWESKNLEEVKAMAVFLEKRYVAPDLKLLLKRNKISKVIFTKDMVDFKYFK